MRRLLFVVTEDWYFMSHRLPMARAAQAHGYEVHVAARMARHGEAIRAEGFHLHPLPWSRRSRSPLTAFADICRLRRLYRTLRPDIVHHIALKPTVLGSLAACRLRGIKIMCTIAGLGHVFTARDRRSRMLQMPFRHLLGFLLSGVESHTIVQNPDDRAMLEFCGVPPDQISLVRGSGVDTERLTPSIEPPGPIRAAFVGRMLTTKGVETLVEAQHILATRGASLTIVLAGTPDPDSTASVSPMRIAEWSRRPGIDYRGYVEDIAALWADVHIAVLPSYREGLPKCLLEAAACGRPIVATDVPGCRDVAVRDFNALLVPAGDAAALADALERLAGDAALRRRFGIAGRRLVETEFSTARINAETVSLYNELLARGATAPCHASGT